MYDHIVTVEKLYDMQGDPYLDIFIDGEWWHVGEVEHTYADDAGAEPNGWSIELQEAGDYDNDEGGVSMRWDTIKRAEVSFGTRVQVREYTMEDIYGPMDEY